jgi:prolyl 3-hydroxylase /prolyl 3,4-dihydroxylase
MAPHNEEDDPAVYRSGSSRNANAIGQTSDYHTPQASGSGLSAGNEASGDDNSDGEDAEGEDDNTLLTVQPGFNRLLLVLRDESVMHFVKYVSAAAEGSRWDVCAEFEIGMIEEDEDI